MSKELGKMNTRDNTQYNNMVQVQTSSSCLHSTIFLNGEKSILVIESIADIDGKLVVQLRQLL